MQHLTKSKTIKLTQDEFDKLAFLKGKKVTINRMFRKLINDQYAIHSTSKKENKITLNDLMKSFEL